MTKPGTAHRSCSGPISTAADLVRATALDDDNPGSSTGPLVLFFAAAAKEKNNRKSVKRAQKGLPLFHSTVSTLRVDAPLNSATTARYTQLGILPNRCPETRCGDGSSWLLQRCEIAWALTSSSRLWRLISPCLCLLLSLLSCGSPAQHVKPRQGAGKAACTLE